MTWFKVDDGFSHHWKSVAAGNAAVGLWVRAGAWSAHQLSDGFVPEHVLATLGTAAQAERLVRVGLWVPVGGGWHFHQWCDRQPTRASVEKRRAQWRDRQRRNRESGDD